MEKDYPVCIYGMKGYWRRSKGALNIMKALSAGRFVAIARASEGFRKDFQLRDIAHKVMPPPLTFI